MSLNINGDFSDPNYRYRMPILEINQTGSGKNSHTILTNIKDIAISLGQSDIIIPKFIGFKLGTNVDNKNNSIKGHYTIETLQTEIFDYINRFVICGNCTIPELIPELEKISKKKKQVNFKCSACGNFTEIKEDKVGKKVIDNIAKMIEKGEWKIKKGTIVNEKLPKITNDFDLFNL
tara:strand:- start:11 stop:541 length:531 start_codon:yes stop_codon:yes gene_type:complete